VKTVAVRYFGQTIELPDVPEYRKFYRKLAAGEWEPDTFRTLSEYLDKQTVYVDIGGWIGVTPFWASHFAQKVVIVEPDPACQAMLRELCRSYSNITLLDGALSPHAFVTIHPVDGFGSSETTALDLGTDECLRVPGTSVKEIMRHAQNEQIFVKIDIEGYEYEIGDEIAHFAGYRLRAMQIALHPDLYERSLKGNRLARRWRTLFATIKLVRLCRALPAAPSATKYRSVLSYLLFAILFRAHPKGTDMIFKAGRESNS
jgi:FkbM family methyltransferase